ncbi:DNA-directed RNA polymerase III subunit C53 PWA37_001694 [Arxiozyma heterogenica]|uniref:DNA-directed RNA polymerase III subunit RPC4 n=1 Tax=Arxiozyma heterogenica TaxID=278026 RepID=A0AAN8A8F0_9SACH|nr:hypothetical protein RI543_002475 [Kazachstania heterogenica]
MSSGRLPSLRDAAQDTLNNPGMKKKTTLKFKPKAGTRRSKEEREASALKVKTEVSIEKKDNKNGNQQNRMGNQRQRRIPRYLANTHVISSGPLAAGNFVGDSGRGGGSMARRGFVKVEGDSSSLVKKGLLTIENNADDSDVDENGSFGDDNDVDEKKDSKNHATKFNMGREYRVGKDDFELDEDDINSDIELDDEALQARRIEEMFPVRPLRIRHEDIYVLKKDIEESLTEAATREQTPGVVVNNEVSSPSSDIKMENDDNINGTLIDTLENKREELQEKLNRLDIGSESQSIDAKEMKIETIQVHRDYEKLRSKLKRVNNKTDKFILFQLPYALPTFQDVTSKDEENETNAKAVKVGEETEDSNNNNNKKNDDVDNSSTKTNGKGDTKKPTTKKTKAKKNKKKITAVPQEELTGRIGSLRVHKSGKITVRVGEVVMEVSRGAETSFIQDIVALDMDDEEAPTVEYLGRVCDRILVTPNFL